MVKLTDSQKGFLRRLGLPDDLDALDDDAWLEVGDRLEDEIQLHGINEAGDGTNGYGDACRQILIAMGEGDES